MQQPEEPANKVQEKAATKLAIFCKMVTLSMRTSIYVCGYYFREEGFTASFISIMVSVGLFLLLETLYWYRWYQTKPPFHKVLTLLLHIHAIANVLGIAFTFKHTVLKPSQHYFFFEFGLLFNYGFTLIQLFSIYHNPAPQNMPDFLKLLCPVVDTMWYLCLSLHLGALLDYLTSSVDSYFAFYTMSFLATLYLLVKLLGLKGVALFRQAFISE